MGSINITVRSNQPRLREGRRYLIDSYASQPRPGEYLIQFESDESNLALHEGRSHTSDYVAVHDLDSVNVRETVQVAS